MNLFFSKTANKYIFICVLIVMSFSLYAKPQKKSQTEKTAVNFTDDLNREISLSSVKNVAVLQGSLASAWLLAGGKIIAATNDCFSEPPEMTKAKADELNLKWNTDAFYEHKAGFLNFYGNESKNVKNVGTMMNPNSELIIASGADFVLLSANITAHKKLMPVLENSGIKCAYFNYENFNSYKNMMTIFTELTNRKDLYEKNVTGIEKKIQEQLDEVEKTKKKSPKILLLRASSSNIDAKSSTSNGMFVGQMLKELGTQNIADSDFSYTENLSMEKIIADNPDFIFVTTMGTDESKAIRSFESKLASNPAWTTLDAVKNKKVYILPRELFHFKAGERWADAYEILEKLLSDY